MKYKTRRIENIEKPIGDISDGISRIFNTLPKITGGVSFFIALAVYTGWVVAESYFREIGAPWLSGTLGIPALVKMSIPIIAPVAGAFIYSSLKILEKKMGKSKNRRLELYFFIAAGIFYAISIIFDFYFNDRYLYIFRQGCSLSISLVTGLVLAKMVRDVGDGTFSWERSVDVLISIVIAYGFFSNPSSLGAAMAKYDSSMQSENLPLVISDGAPKNRDWRLLLVNDNFYVLVALSSRPENSIFHVVNIKDKITVEAVAKKNW